MITITSTYKEIEKALCDYKMPSGYTFQEGEVEVWQFYNGTQGGVRRVGLYKGKIIKFANLPVLRGLSCVSSQIELGFFSFVVIQGRLIEVENNKVAFPSDFKLPPNTDEILEKIRVKKAELAALIEQLNA